MRCGGANRLALPLMGACRAGVDRGFIKYEVLTQQIEGSAIGVRFPAAGRHAAPIK